MAYSGVERRYARALFQAGPNLEAELLEVEKLLSENPGLTEVLLSPQIDRARKQKIIEQIFKGVSDPCLNFLRLLVEKNRFALFSGIREIYQQLVLESRSELQAIVETVIPLPAEQESELIAVLTQREGRKVKLQNQINPELLGGMLIKMGDRIIDLSLSGRFKELKETMLKP